MPLHYNFPDVQALRRVPPAASGDARLCRVRSRRGSRERAAHGVLFANHPISRGSMIGSDFLVFDALFNHDSLDAGRRSIRDDEFGSLEMR